MREQPLWQDPGTGACRRWDPEFEKKMSRTERKVRQAYDWDEEEQIQFHALWRLRCLLHSANDEAAMRVCASQVARSLPCTFASALDLEQPVTTESILTATRHALPVPSDIPHILNTMDTYRTQNDNDRFKYLDQTPESTFFLGMVYAQGKEIWSTQQQHAFLELITLINHIHQQMAVHGKTPEKKTKRFRGALKAFVLDLPVSTRDHALLIIEWARDYLYFLVQTVAMESYSGTKTDHTNTLGFVTVPAHTKGDESPLILEEHELALFDWKKVLVRTIDLFKFKLEVILQNIPEAE